ncbi:unnamed protein product [Musa acuminata subsp. burmannicoides]
MKGDRMDCECNITICSMCKHTLLQGKIPMAFGGENCAEQYDLIKAGMERESSLREELEQALGQVKHYKGKGEKDSAEVMKKLEEVQKENESLKAKAEKDAKNQRVKKKWKVEMLKVRALKQEIETLNKHQRRVGEVVNSGEECIVNTMRAKQPPQYQGHNKIEEKGVLECNHGSEQRCVCDQG